MTEPLFRGTVPEVAAFLATTIAADLDVGEQVTLRVLGGHDAQRCVMVLEALNRMGAQFHVTVSSTEDGLVARLSPLADWRAA